MEANNMLLNNQWLNHEIKEEKKNTRREKKMKHNGPKSLGCRKISFKMEVYSNRGLPQK